MSTAFERWRLRAEPERREWEDGEAPAGRAGLLPTPQTRSSYLPDALFGAMGIPRPRFEPDDTDAPIDAGRRVVGVPRPGRCGVRVPIGFSEPAPGEDPDAFAERVCRGIRSTVAASRCDYVPRPGRIEDRCPRPASLRVLRHGPVPAYRERCLLHCGEVLGPLVGAVWDPLQGEWVERAPL